MTETEKALLAALATLMVELVKKEWRPIHEHQPVGVALKQVEARLAELSEPPRT